VLGSLTENKALRHTIYLCCPACPPGRSTRVGSQVVGNSALFFCTPRATAGTLRLFAAAIDTEPGECVYLSGELEEGAIGSACDSFFDGSIKRR